MVNVLKKKSLGVLTLLSLLFVSVSCGDSGNVSIPGVQGPNVNLLEDNLIVSMVLEDVEIMAGATYKVPKYKKSFLGLNPNLEGVGSVLTFTVSLDDIFSADVKELDPKTLPGGRMIPGVASGALPAVAFSVDSLKNMAFYVGPSIFGIWVPLPKFELYGFAWTKAFNVGEKRVGNVTLFGKDEEGNNSGFFLGLSVKSAYEKRLKSLSKKY
ncbi:hypothetical protein [Bacteriovorax sp. Seq25_V]|uniref:hypothetical protein n=1 Tax=Bacteriovorax sp. Seq25_V TaxID=1201288 RepID=UPI000389E454|nr:hypothetical protein [Bacteriovorax sp. Seq25_V]EQC47387.1 putative lipoprotein [Bacteriovorax sp. Seq25_V]